VDVSENNYGVAILNDGKYGFGVDDGDLSMTLIKSAGYPFEGANEKTPTFTYSLLPHKGSGVSGGIVEKAYVLNRPFFVREVEKTSGRLPEEYSLMECKTAGVIVETVKRAEDGDGIIVRMYEAYKERKTARLDLPKAREVYLCDLNERELQKMELDGGMVGCAIKPFEVITLKIKTN
jgi:alpha-mannosidase